MPVVLNYNATVVTPTVNGTSIPIPLAPGGVGVAAVVVNVPNSNQRFVEIKATVGLQGTSGIGGVLFVLFRDGVEIYRFRQDLLNGFNEYALVTLQAVDGNATVGPHTYTLGAQIQTPSSLVAAAVGPIDISATVIG
ncbi:hypothetical protein J19TS2_41140 [Cohnella xylanilytica]|uniref:exosporium protein C n=1 Tax=Cohnella xylanilytica TaxID=557555 RepID=UPI001B0D0032|nr:exosporium protein C [Cohnella xylanilytica]GIO14559.1 hypothetical protein J19TS2_41140 [Cohnella xylanilytica]